MKLIPLTQDKFAMVDDEDYEKLIEYKWNARKMNNVFYAGRTISIGGGKRRPLMMHHVIMPDLPPKMERDHKDGNGLNNQKENLRFVTRRQNQQNAINSRIKKTSKYPGVSFDSRRNKWKAYIKINGYHKDIGRFDSELEAFEVYCDAVKNVGDFVISEA
jgi:hypothetical protein